MFNRITLLLFLLYDLNAQIALPSFHAVHTPPPPPPNYAFSFDGTDDIVDCEDIINLRQPEYFTIMFWFNRTSSKDGGSHDTNHSINNVMYSKGSGSYNDNIEIGTDGTSIEIYLDSNNGDHTVSHNAGITNDEWYHITVTYDKDQSNELLLYLDGSLVASFSNSSGKLDQTTNSPVTIGDTDHESKPFHGLIDEVAVWTSVLDSSQIAAIYNNGNGINNVATSYSSNLELYIKFESELSDDSVNSHTISFGVNPGEGSGGTNTTATYNLITSSLPLQ